MERRTIKTIYLSELCGRTVLYSTRQASLTPEEFAASVAARPASPPKPVVSIAPTCEDSDVQQPRSANL